MMPVQWNASERGAHFEPGEAFGTSGLFAEAENATADALSRPVRMNKEGANPGGVHAWIEERIVSSRPVIAAIRGSSARPPAAANEPLRIGDRLHSEVRAVRDELRVEPKPGTQRSFALRGGVVLRLQAAHRRFDERNEPGCVAGNCEAETEMGDIPHGNILRRMVLALGAVPRAIRYNHRLEQFCAPAASALRASS